MPRRLQRLPCAWRARESPICSRTSPALPPSLSSLSLSYVSLDRGYGEQLLSIFFSTLLAYTSGPVRVCAKHRNTDLLSTILSTSSFEHAASSPPALRDAELTSPHESCGLSHTPEAANPFESASISLACTRAMQHVGIVDAPMFGKAFPCKLRIPSRHRVLMIISPPPLFFALAYLLPGGLLPAAVAEPRPCPSHSPVRWQRFCRFQASVHCATSTPIAPRPWRTGKQIP